MEKHHVNLVNYALNHQCVISVNDGEVWSLKRSSDPSAIFAEIEGVDESFVKIYDDKGAFMGFAFIVLDNAMTETVNDHSTTPFFEAWDDQLPV